MAVRVLLAPPSRPSNYLRGGGDKDRTTTSERSKKRIVFDSARAILDQQVSWQQDMVGGVAEMVLTKH